MKRDFNEWISTFRNNLFTYEYYTNFEKVYNNVDEIKIELNLLNSLVGSKNIKYDFIRLINNYPEVLKCIPILIAKREKEIYAFDDETENIYSFIRPNLELEEYLVFMEKTGLFELIENRIINNLVDYVMGVEVGLDTNARKNRTGHLMEDLVEDYIKDVISYKNAEYYKEMYAKDMASKWGVILNSLINEGKNNKRFDFVVKTENNIYAFETNFYNSGGSKLNETARSYKTLFLESQNIEGFKFIWITDGGGWKTAKNGLEETFDITDDLYNLNDLKNGVLDEVIV